MRFRLDALLKPVDPVVGTFRSSCDADESLAVLRRAGFGHADLTVIGRAGADADPIFATGRRASGLGASGAGLGLLWALLATTMALLSPMGAAALVPLLAMATLTLGLQAAVIGRVVGAVREPRPGHLPAAPRVSGGDSPRADWLFHIVVHGSRSDIELARALVMSRRWGSPTKCSNSSRRSASPR